MEKSDKKRILTRVLIVIAALTLLSCCFLGSTFARYVTRLLRLMLAGILVLINFRLMMHKPIRVLIVPFGFKWLPSTTLETSMPWLRFRALSLLCPMRLLLLVRRLMHAMPNMFPMMS